MPNSAAPQFSLDLHRVVNPNPGWYGGDFHTHTHHSDGALSAPELAALAQCEGMDFLTITDHNTLDAYPNFGEPPNLCIIPGLEVTYRDGHYNVFGLTESAPWQKEVTHGPTFIRHEEANIDPDTLIAQSAAQGLLNSINHPLLPPWAWLFPETDLRDIHCLEIWNDPSWPDNRVGNPLAVEMWTRWLNAGHRITAIGGSDYHRPANKAGTIKPPDRLGSPRTYVYADNLSGAAILDGLRRRQVYVSMGAQVDFTAEHQGIVYPIGTEIDTEIATEIATEIDTEIGARTDKINFTAKISACGRGVAQILHNGKVISETLLYGEATTIHASVELEPTTSAWFRLDVLDGNGLLLAMTNPIFVGPRPTPTLNAYGDFVDVSKPALR